MVWAEAVTQVHSPGLSQRGSLQADLVTFLETIHFITFGNVHIYLCKCYLRAAVKNHVPPVILLQEILVHLKEEFSDCVHLLILVAEILHVIKV